MLEDTMVRLVSWLGEILSQNVQSSVLLTSDWKTFFINTDSLTVPVTSRLAWEKALDQIAYAQDREPRHVETCLLDRAEQLTPDSPLIMPVFALSAAYASTISRKNLRHFFKQNGMMPSYERQAHAAAFASPTL